MNVSSMGGRLTLPGGAPYHASKHAVEAMSDALRYEAKPFGVGVSVIEPGPIMSKWVDTAVQTSTEHTRDDGPYADFMEGVAARTASGYEGALGAMAGSVESVARVIERAIKRRWPRPRYRVTGVARMMLVNRALLTDRGWDRALRLMYPVPKPR